MILLIDNYDSFTYNIYQYLCDLKLKVNVVRNDSISIKKIEKINPKAIVLSPGPGHPNSAGICIEVINHFGAKKPILGICLGHQAIGVAYGGCIIKSPKMMHGKTSLINHNRRGIYSGIINPMEVTRYHSLIIERSSLPRSLRITAETDNGIIMSIKHKKNPVVGVQFHPESYLTSDGIKIFSNFIDKYL